MIFTEFRFLIFAVVVFAVHWSLRSNSQRKLWLLASSYVFYAAWDWRFLSLIFISTLVDYVAGVRIEKCEQRAHKRHWILLSLTSNLGLLATFKYFNFFVDSFSDFASFFSIPIDQVVLDVVLPVGISFYTFQTLGYTIDVYRGNLRATHRFLDFALFVAFFPQLVAGPIVRAQDFLYQLEENPRWRQVDLRWALMLFLVGFFKKACVADNLSVYVDAYFGNPMAYGLLDSWLATSMYAAQIYCDFSGYSDMAIATAGLLGYRLRGNFLAPYFSVNIAEFWRRWHISLSSWLRDYLYFSLGGSRHGQLLTYRNLMLTMLLGGLWHGASWNFVLWGGMHGVALIIHRLWSASISRPPKRSRTNQLASTILTFVWVCMAWVPFRAESFADTLIVWGRLWWPADALASLTGEYVFGAWVVMVGLTVAHYFSYKGHFVRFWRSCSTEAFSFFYAVAVSGCLAIRTSEYQAFIYFQF